MTWLIKHLRNGLGVYWPGSQLSDEAEWQRIAGLTVADTCGYNQVDIHLNRIFNKIKLRTLATDLDVYRWTMEFNDGSILDLSLPRLLDGTESKAVTITGKMLKRIVVKYDSREVARRGRLEIWAQV